MVPVRARRLEAEDVADAIQVRLGRLLVDAHGAVALDVRMPSNRRDAGAGLAEIATQQQQVRDLLDQL